MQIILYSGGPNWKREEHILDAANPTRLFIPIDVATGLENIGDEEGWLINYPDPPYDPALRTNRSSTRRPNSRPESSSDIAGS